MSEDANALALEKQGKVYDTTVLIGEVRVKDVRRLRRRRKIKIVELEKERVKLWIDTRATYTVLNAPEGKLSEHVMSVAGAMGRRR